MRLSFRLSLGTRFGTQGSFKTGSSLVFKTGLSLPRRAIKIIPKLVSQLSRGLKKKTLLWLIVAPDSSGWSNNRLSDLASETRLQSESHVKVSPEISLVAGSES